MTQEVILHYEYEKTQISKSDLLQHKLDVRRKILLEKTETIQSPEFNLEERKWLERSYPVLSILAPVMSTSEGKIEFPGDPMCLYSALSYAIGQAVNSRKMGICEDAPYNDLCPQWGYLPSQEYREQADVNGIREYDGALLNTDQTVFDPRVWNEKVKRYFESRWSYKVKINV